MSAVLTSTNCQKEAIERAQKVFARLPRDDAVFQHCVGNGESIHELLTNTFQKKGHYNRKTSTILLDRFEKYTSWMTTISDSINIAVQASAGIACPVWAPIKFVLIVSHNHAKAAQQILHMVEMIKENLPRLELYAQVNNDGGFQAQLLDLFTDIAEFAIHAYRFFSRRSLVRLSRLMSRSFQDEYGDVISRMERRTKAIDGLAVALALERHEQLLRETQAMHHQDEANRKRDQARNWLRAPNIKESQDSNLKLRTGATCEWILNHSDFQSWTNSDPANEAERVLIIHGPAGCGKSVLGSFLQDTLSKSSAGRFITLLFSFSAGDAERQTVDSLVRSLLSQLLQHNLDGGLLPLLENLQASGPPSTSSLLETLGKGIALSSLPIRLLIDGVDECSDGATFRRDDLIQWTREQSIMKTILLGRSHAFKSLSNPTTSGLAVSIDYGLNRGDIQTFIHNEMGNWHSLSSQDVREQITKTLSGQADGMFLWVKLMIDHLKSFKYDEARVRSLGDLPNGLDRSYSRILGRLAKTLTEHEQQIVCAALSFTATSGRPLRMDEFRVAYALSTMPVSSSASAGFDQFLLQIEPEELVELCGGLLIFTQGRFNLLHSSTREYLARAKEQWRSTEHQSTWIFQIDTTQAHRILGEICIRLLAEVDYSIVQWDEVQSLDTMESRQPLLQYTCLYLAYHLNRSGLSPVQLQAKVLDLLRSDQCFLALEQLASHALADFPAAQQLEMWILASYTFPEGHNYSEIISLFSSHVENEHTSRASRFGEHDPRTVVAVTMSTVLSDLRGTSDISAITFQEEQDRTVPPTRERFELSLGTENSSTPLNSAYMSNIRRTRPQTTTLSFQRIRNLLQNSHTGILGNQFEFAVTLLRHMTMSRLVIDPLEAIWRLVKQKASTMPVTLVAALAVYYHRMGRNERAYELGSTCLSRLGDGHLALRILVRHLMGFVAYHLEEYEEGIDHFEFSLPQEERWFKVVSPETLNARIIMGKCYEGMERFENAIEVLEDQRQWVSKSRIVSTKQKLELYFDLGYYQYVCARYEDAHTSRRQLLDILQTALEDSKGDLAYRSSVVRFRCADIRPSPLTKKCVITRAIGDYLDHLSGSDSPEYIWDWGLPDLTEIFYRLMINMLAARYENLARLKEEFGIEIDYHRCSDFLRAEYSILEDKEFSSQARADFGEVLRLYEKVHRSQKSEHSEHFGDKILGSYYQARIYYYEASFNCGAELIKKIICSYDKYFLAGEATAKRNLSILWLTLAQLELKRSNDLDAAKAAQNSYSLISAISRDFEDTAAISAVVRHSVHVTQDMVQQFGPHDWARMQHQNTDEEDLKIEENFPRDESQGCSLETTVGGDGDHVIEKRTTLGPGMLPLLIRLEEFHEYIPWRRSP